MKVHSTSTLEEKSEASSSITPAAIRNQKAVDFWMQKKMLHRTALEAMAQLSGDRAKNEKEMKEAAVAIYAVEHLFRVQGLFTVTREEIDFEAGDENILVAANAAKAVPAPKASKAPKKSEEESIKELTEKRKEELSMFKHFSKWVKDNKYTFSNVHLSKEDLKGVKVGEQTFKLLKVDLLEEDDEGEKSILQSLPFVSLRKDDDGKKADKTTVVTNKLNPNDQFCNFIYMRELKKLWLDAKKELQTRVQEAMGGGGSSSSSSSSTAADRKSMEDGPGGSSGPGKVEPQRYLFVI